MTPFQVRRLFCYALYTNNDKALHFVLELTVSTTDTLNIDNFYLRNKNNSLTAFKISILSENYLEIVLW